MSSPIPYNFHSGYEIEQADACILRLNHG